MNQQQQHPTTEELIDYLHGELGPQADATILMHLEACEECTARYGEQALLSEQLRRYAKSSEREFPAGIRARIFDQIERERTAPSLGARIAAFWRPAIAVPVAAVLIVGAFFGYSTTHRQAPTTIDALYYFQDHAALTNTVPFAEGNAVPSNLRNDYTTTAQAPVAPTDSRVVAVLR